MVSIVCISKTLYFSLFLLISLIGILLAIIWPPIFEKLIANELTLTESSKTYKAWENTTLPLYLDFYMFNWTNPEESLANPNVKPILVEMGPYVFREEHQKLNVTWNPNNNTVSYWQRRTWYFEPELSHGSLDDVITSVNVVAVTIATMADNIDVKFADMIKKIINLFLKSTEKKLYIRKTVRELLFEGYEDDVLELMKKLDKLLPMPVESRFGWFYPRNTSDTYDGVANIHTGVGDLNVLGMMGAWNYMNETKFYNGECGKVQGSAGDLFPPSIAKREAFTIYATDICSGINLKSTHTDSLIHDLPGTQFVADRDVFDNGSKYPENECYCAHKQCSDPSGIRDLSPCKKGAPAYLSFPHFYLGDPVYSNAIDGLSPNKSQHEFAMVIEKNTGIPLQVNARLQINILLRKIKNLDITSGLTHLVMPALWFHQHLTIPKEMADELRPLCDIPIYAYTIALSLLLGGILGLIVGMVVVKMGACSRPTESALLDETSADSTSLPNDSLNLPQDQPRQTT